MNISAEYLSSKKWGIFQHYLYSTVCSPQKNDSLAAPSSRWNDAINSIDVERLAYSLHKMNVGYYFITLMQGTKFMLAPNSTYDSIAGTKAGEACALRDLPLELSKALEKYGIDLCLYYTGDGPWADEIISRKFGFTKNGDDITEEFVKKWASVLEEYALRYGNRVKAWWIDGCYGPPADFRPESFGYTEELLYNYYKAIKKGNPDAAVTFNNGVYPKLSKYTSFEDYTAGEARGIYYKHPQTKYIDGALNHVLFPLGINKDFSSAAWNCGGVKYDRDYLLSYVKRIGELGGAVTIDVKTFIDGSFDPEQEEVLRFIGERL